MSTLHVRIITPQGAYKELDTEILNVSTIDGERGILPNHMPLVTSLKIGKMSTIENGVRNVYAVAGGILYFNNNEAKILSDAVENKDEINYERALAAKERAEQRIKDHDSNTDLKRATLALSKALNRVSVAGK